MAAFLNYNWCKLADSLEEIKFGPNGLVQVDVPGKTITLALSKGKIFACPQKCPHAGGNLSEGFLDPLGNIVCPLHKYKFNLINGINTSGEGYYLTRYPVEIRANGIYIAIET